MLPKPKNFARIKGLRIAVCGENEVARFSREAVTHVISIWDAQRSCDDEHRNWIRGIFPKGQIEFAYFDDIARDPFDAAAPKFPEVQRILEISESLPSRARLLVHCRAGISRSTAIALAIMSQHAGPGHEVECLRALLQIRPHALPNALVVSFADEILARSGKLSSALTELPEIFRELVPLL